MEEIRNLLALFGTGVLIMLVYFILVLFKGWIEDRICDIRWKHKYRHRFDKEPKAKCYCYDCIDYNKKDDFCRLFNVSLGDSGFCSRGTPSKIDPDSKSEVKTK